MKFFHVYNEEYFEGLVKNNFINEDTGFKVQHCFSVPAHMRFNTFAAKGSKLHSMIRDNNYPFYVDRISGGIAQFNYDFDKPLIREYRKLVGEWFLGFQQHETGGNRALDWIRTLDRMEGQKGPYENAEVLTSRSASRCAITPEGTRLYGFNQGYPDEYASLPYPETLEDLYRDFEGLFRRRMEATDGMILPCDSGALLTKMQNDLGMQTFMPEVGCQIPHMRIQVALARGMALANKKKWGVYYECWRWTEDAGYSMPCFNSEPGNEWYLSQENHPDDFTSYGTSGGSSRLLQNRIYHYGLMSGAHLMGEEWGLNCSYSDMNTFELSHYGQVKKDFIEFSRSHRQVEAKIPFAIVLPANYPCIRLIKDWPEIGQWATESLKRTFTDYEYKQNGRIEDVLKLFFRRKDEDIVGNEGHTMQNTRFGDLFDIIYEDCPEEAFAKYEALIDLTDNERFSNLNGNKYRILSGADPYALGDEIEQLAKQVMPVYADCCHWLLSSDENGRYITVFNNEGNERDLFKGDIIHHEADKIVMLTMKKASEPAIIQASSKNVKIEKIGDGRFALTLPATDFAIIKY